MEQTTAELEVLIRNVGGESLIMYFPEMDGHERSAWLMWLHQEGYGIQQVMTNVFPTRGKFGNPVSISPPFDKLYMIMPAAGEQWYVTMRIPQETLDSLVAAL